MVKKELPLHSIRVDIDPQIAAKMKLLLRMMRSRRNAWRTSGHITLSTLAEEAFTDIFLKYNPLGQSNSWMKAAPRHQSQPEF